MLWRFRLNHEAASGLVLMLAAALGILLANSRLAPYYDLLLSVRGTITLDGFGIEKSALEWINEFQMSIFFLFVGLELKRELIAGELTDRSRAILPVVGAVGGMILPALTYLALTWHSPDARPGWAVPAATDTAFALGIISLLGSRVAPSLKLLLTALAIFDDLGAIAIIAVFYTGDLSWVSLAVALAALAVLIALNLAGVERVTWYLLIGLVLWLFVLKSGVHATLAGVALAFAIPYRTRPGGTSPLLRVVHELRPWVEFGILPLFGFANAGLSFADLSLSSLIQPIPLGVAAGLFLGKQLGVFGALALAIRAGWAELPRGASWCALYGTSALAGVGFTMSLFIGTLAFGASGHEAAMRLGVLLGSTLSGTIGVGALVLGATRPSEPPQIGPTEPSDGANPRSVGT